jgi:Ca-activated chloride channel family protein
MRKALLVPTIGLMLFVVTGGALADGMLFPTTTMPGQPFSVKYHRVTVTIDNQIAKTHVDQAFVNDSDRVLEGTYLFPVPEGARIRDFAIYEGDKPLRGELLRKEEAVGIYEDIVRRQRDPGLLEYVGRDTVRARVFPIPPHSEKRFTVDYAEVIARDDNLCHYLYPLSTERFSARPLEEVTITVRVKSQVPIKNLYCPSHEISIRQPSDRDAEVSYEASHLKPATDFELFYALNEDEVGLTLLTYKEKGERGYWMLLASPKLPAKEEVVAKDVVFVLDRTGSMSGEKMQQAKEALRYCLDSLSARDRFDLVTFNETAESVADTLMPANAANVRKAEKRVREMAARGGTNIDEALRKALRLFAGGSRPKYVVFLTDGQPTVGQTNTDTIRRHVAASNEGRVRFFVFGVGYDVNVHFLDKLSEENRGLSEYVRPQENLEVKVSRFYSKVSAPVLTDVSLHTDGVKITDIFPRGDLPDIFAGSQMIMVGTYRDAGAATFALTGKRAGPRGGASALRYAIKTHLAAHSTRYDFIPVLWASRRIGYLLDQVRLHGDKELVDEIVALSKEFGIMTEFTAFLAKEPEMSRDAATSRVIPLMERASQEQRGSWSVGQTQNAARLRAASAPNAAVGGYGAVGAVPGFVTAPTLPGVVSPAGPAGPPGPAGAPMPGLIGGNQTYIDAEGRVQVVGGVQNVGRQTFYQRGNAWVDQRVNAKTRTVNIQRLSEAHFQLARASAEARRYLALGDNVTFFMNGQAIVVGEKGKTRLTSAELKAIVGTASG